MYSPGKHFCKMSVFPMLRSLRHHVTVTCVSLRGAGVCTFVVSLTYFSNLLSHEWTIRLDMILMSGIECKSKADAGRSPSVRVTCQTRAPHHHHYSKSLRKAPDIHSSICQWWTSPLLAPSDWPAEMPIIVAKRWRRSKWNIDT